MTSNENRVRDVTLVKVKKSGGEEQTARKKSQPRIPVRSVKRKQLLLNYSSFPILSSLK